MGLRLTDSVPLHHTAVFLHADGRQLHLPVAGCEVWSFEMPELGPALLSDAGEVLAMAICADLARLMDGLWGYAGVRSIPCGHGACGQIRWDGLNTTVTFDDGRQLTATATASGPQP